MPRSTSAGQQNPLHRQGRRSTDYGEPFARLQYPLKRYLDSIANFESEQRFEHLVEEIDHECRVAQDEFEGIRRKHSRSVTGLLVTSSLVGVAAVSELVAPGVATAASAALGSVSPNHVLSQRIKTSDETDDLKRSDYWIAWKLHQENAARETP